MQFRGAKRLKINRMIIKPRQNNTADNLDEFDLAENELFGLT